MRRELVPMPLTRTWPLVRRGNPHTSNGSDQMMEPTRTRLHRTRTATIPTGIFKHSESGKEIEQGKKRPLKLPLKQR